MLLVESHVVFSNIGGYVVIISQYKASYKGYEKITFLDMTEDNVK